MKIYVAGATGAVGRRLVPLLVSRGHHVVATTRSAMRTSAIRELGAEPLVIDALDRDAVIRSVQMAKPEVIVHQLSALSQLRSLKRFDEEFAVTNRLRTEGTDYLLEGARAAGAKRLVAQSYTGWPNSREGSRIKTEDDPLDPHPPHAMRQSLDAIRYLERVVIAASDIEGIVLRYGSFYGPGTSFAPGGDILEAVRRRMFPLVGAGTGVWSFVHMDDVAAATTIATEGVPPGVYNIVDDDPAEVATWLPALARTIGAKPPRRVPSWVARLIIGEAGVAVMTQSRASSNAKAKRVFNWQPAYASWRDGFRHELSADGRHGAHAAT
jgi:nucleoside-diphosphate-sugar epimerase